MGALAACAALFGAGSVHAAGSAQAGQAKAAVCAGCHGLDGNSPAETWPKIAGQLPEYIMKQLHDFKAGLRKNEQMSPMAQPLSEQDIQDVAAYFSSQRAAPGEGRKELLATGEKIYLKGKGRPSVVIACVGCHGPRGEGKSDWARTLKLPPTTLAPALGSQHPGYVATQLRAFRSGARSNDTGKVMRNITSRMSDADIDAVAAYVVTLKR
ncbi:MAG: c-type cytochrome [Rhodocyclaceae bacterium]